MVVRSALDAAGYGARTGWLTAPVPGERSWLADANLLTFLRIDHRQRHASRLASERRSRVHGSARALRSPATTGRR
ncbi:MAG: hypothetical protein ACLFU0_06075 [Alphaproteobacteria bacterium]